MALWNLFASFFRSPSKEERRAYRHSAKKEEPVRVDALLKKVESELKWSVDLSAVPTVAPRLRLELDGSFKPFLFEDGLFVVHGSVIKRFDFDGQPTGELAAPVAGARPVQSAGANLPGRPRRVAVRPPRPRTRGEPSMPGYHGRAPAPAHRARRSGAGG